MFIRKDHQLTQTEVLFLRKARSVCFDLFGRRENPTSQIRTSDSDNRTEIAIPVDAKVIVHGNVYSRSTGQYDYKCFEMIHYAQDVHWLTIARALRTGDRIELEWTTCAGNGYLKGAKTTVKDIYEFNERLYRCELRLKAYRKLASGKEKVFEWLIDVSITTDNSARMVKVSNGTF